MDCRHEEKDDLSPTQCHNAATNFLAACFHSTHLISCLSLG